MLLTLFQSARRNQGRFNEGLGTSFQLWKEIYHHHLRLLNQISWLKFGRHLMYRCIQNGGDYKGSEGVCKYLFTHALTPLRWLKLRNKHQMLSEVLSVFASNSVSCCKLTIIWYEYAGKTCVGLQKVLKLHKEGHLMPPGVHLILRNTLRNILTFYMKKL